VVFFGVSQLGTYMTYFYDLCAAIEELSLFYEIEQEDFSGTDEKLEGGSDLALVNARGQTRGNTTTLNFELPGGSRVLACTASHSLQRMFTNFMKRHDVPQSGYIAVGGHDTKSIQAHALRHEIIVLDRPTVIEMTIREYLRLSADKVNASQILDTLKAVDLADTVAQLKEGLDTQIAVTGWPLSITETLRLKLAAALIAKPRILVIGPLYDVLPGDTVHNALDVLQKSATVTVIHFSLRPEDNEYDHFLYLGQNRQRVFTDYAQFNAHIDRHVNEVDDRPEHLRSTDKRTDEGQ